MAMFKFANCHKLPEPMEYLQFQLILCICVDYGWNVSLFFHIFEPFRNHPRFGVAEELVLDRLRWRLVERRAQELVAQLQKRHKERWIQHVLQGGILRGSWLEKWMVNDGVYVGKYGKYMGNIWEIYMVNDG